MRIKVAIIAKYIKLFLNLCAKLCIVDLTCIYARIVIIARYFKERGVDMKSVDVAKNIINYCISIKKPITNLHLQKTLYFLDIYHLVNYKTRLIDESFEAWKMGPVISEVYYEFSYSGANPITTIQEIKEEFLQETRGYLFGFIDKIAKMNTWDLVEISHSTSPWEKTFDKNNPNKRPKIDPQLLEEYAQEARQQRKH